MSRSYVRWVMGAAVAIGWVSVAAAQSGNAGGGQGGPAPDGPPMKLTSPAFNDFATTVAAKHTCVDPAKAVSPALQWSNAPKETVSFALIAHDPDGHPGKGYADSLHWLV